MKFSDLLQRRKVFLVTLVCACGTLAGAGIWQTTANEQKKQREPAQLTELEQKQDTQRRARKGVGDKVHFASEKESVDKAVESVAAFINERSGMAMSEDTKKKVAKLEQAALKGKEHRISVEQLTDVLTEVATERLALLNDQDIERAVNIYKTTSDGEVSTRDIGKWGYLPKEELVFHLKASRDQSKRGAFAMRSALRPDIEAEVNERVSYLSESLPEQFGNVQTDGVTPLQVLLLAYSVAADDDLLDSPKELAEEKVRRRIAQKQHKPKDKAQRRESTKPFGVNGFLYSSPADLMFNKASVDKLLNRMEGAKDKK